MRLGICIAGASGGVGRSLVRAVIKCDDLSLCGAVARGIAGQDAGVATGGDAVGVTVVGSVAEALAAPCDVLIDYTHPDVIMDNVMVAFERGVHVVIGTSGLTAGDFQRIDASAREAGLGAIAGNFSLTAALLQHFSLIAARHIPQWEIIEYAKAEKPDAPSGTARELAELLSDVAQPQAGQDISHLHGPPESRGAVFGSTRVHSVRLPGYEHTVEAIFGLGGERLVMRHEATSPAAPYVEGSLLAARRAPEITGLVRGLDTLLFG